MNTTHPNNHRIRLTKYVTILVEYDQTWITSDKHDEIHFEHAQGRHFFTINNLTTMLQDVRGGNIGVR